MVGHADRRDRLCVVQVGSRRLALPLTEVRQFAPAHQVQPVAGAVPWITGLLAEHGTGAWLPVIDLARLWDDPSLVGAWTQLVATTAGLAIGTSGYSMTREPVPLVDLRPAPGNPALGRAAIVAAQPIPIITADRLVQPGEWQALAATA